MISFIYYIVDVSNFYNLHFWTFTRTSEQEVTGIVPSICCRISVQSCARTVESGLATVESKDRSIRRKPQYVKV